MRASDETSKGLNQTENTPARLLLVDDKPTNLDVLILHLKDAGHDLSVALSGEEAIKLSKAQLPSLILLDVMMPGIDGFETCVQLKNNPETKHIPIIFMSALSDTQSKVKGFAVGGVDFICKPIQREEVLARVNAHLMIQSQHQLLQTQNKSLLDLNEQLQDQVSRREIVEKKLAIAGEKLSALGEQEAKQWGIDGFIGNSPQITAILDEIRNLQHVDKTNVLILGESGTGKELVSRAIHFGSRRKKNAFVAVNCSAIPSDLADAEFFGHTKGAFTGAVSSRPGYFVQADGGTLFLDEIGDMPLMLQAKLLRVLEDGMVSPVGGSKVQKVNVRVVAATNVDLKDKVAAKTFRGDLYYRLSGYVIQLPPLRKRMDDIPSLIDRFLAQLAPEMGLENATISKQALQALQKYPFPGNVRELKNLIEHALISSRGKPIGTQHLRFIDEGFLDEGVCEPEERKIESRSVVIQTRHRESDESLILHYLKEHGQIDNTTTQVILEVEHSRASYLLKKLLQEKRINKEGQRRWAYYTLA